ncbi:hypothetical protein CON70_11680 [Bacillus pseudomycoides]|uniref:hypothetical protein n=1 Tax=Bacillus pseudomycoides TaxID=64104 RepID=UPI000BEC0566|nr:hypothetical protein [Bacillus pseudomycoides]PDZ11432.1 hypothetical protein CON70_11680 [Bacillus pseudomycoides]
MNLIISLNNGAYHTIKGVNQPEVNAFETWLNGTTASCYTLESTLKELGITETKVTRQAVSMYTVEGKPKAN